MEYNASYPDLNIWLFAFLLPKDQLSRWLCMLTTIITQRNEYYVDEGFLLAE